MVPFSDARPGQGYLSVDAAARRLGLPVAQMLGLNMVILLPDGQGGEHVPEWCADPAVATVMPLLSDHFTGEALEFCLVHMRPRSDGRSGIDLLYAGDWQIVRDTLGSFRIRLEQIMRLCDTRDWLTGYANGAARAAPFLS